MKKTECSKGHQLTPENTYSIEVTYYDKKMGKDYTFTRVNCRTCMREQKRRRTAKARKLVIASAAPTDRCRRGHAYTEENIEWHTRNKVKADGTPFVYRHKACKECLRINRKAHKERHPVRREPAFDKTHCKRGHLMRGDNVAVHTQYTRFKNGMVSPYKVRRCLACRRLTYEARELKKGRVIVRKTFNI